jgi:hypothetical protein
MKFTKIKVNYETGATLRKQTTRSNRQSLLQKNYSCSSGQNVPRFYEPEGSLGFHIKPLLVCILSQLKPAYIYVTSLASFLTFKNRASYI